MKYNVYDLKNDIATAMHGTNLSRVYNINGIIEMSARELVTRNDILELRRESLLPFVYSDTAVLAVPNDLTRKKIIEVGVDGNIIRNVSLGGNNKINNSVNIFYKNGLKLMEIDGAQIPLSMSVIEFDDKVNVSGTDISNIKVDSFDYIQGIASLSFSNTALQIFSIEKSGLNLDLIPYVGDGSFYTFVKIPGKANLETIKVEVYTDDTNYYSLIVDKDAFDLQFVSGEWNVVKFDWSKASITGTPDPTSITKIKFTFNDLSGFLLDNWKIDSIIASVEDTAHISYYSSFVFSSEDGKIKNKITTDNDKILLDADGAYQMFVYLTAMHTAKHLGNTEDEMSLKADYYRARSIYSGDMPSEAQKTKVRYYKTRKRRF